VPFVPQDEYDRILWSCDLNFVRGEDSFVRAQWAARPLVWNVYAQAEDAHRLKLDAFLDRYDGQDPTALAALNRAWNGAGSLGSAWSAARRARARLTARAEAWASTLLDIDDLGTSLVTFCQNRL
jgi:uncharacterized repeat protein (TIGR03837 family)